MTTGPATENASHSATTALVGLWWRVCCMFPVCTLSIVSILHISCVHASIVRLLLKYESCMLSSIVRLLLKSFCYAYNVISTGYRQHPNHSSPYWVHDQDEWSSCPHPLARLCQRGWRQHGHQNHAGKLHQHPEVQHHEDNAQGTVALFIGFFSFNHLYFVIIVDSYNVLWTQKLFKKCNVNGSRPSKSTRDHYAIMVLY